MKGIREEIREERKVFWNTFKEKLRANFDEHDIIFKESKIMIYCRVMMRLEYDYLQSYVNRLEYDGSQLHLLMSELTEEAYFFDKIIDRNQYSEVTMWLASGLTKYLVEKLLGLRLEEELAA